MPTSDITRAITARSRRGFLRAGAAGAAAVSTAPLWAPQDAAAAKHFLIHGYPALVAAEVAVAIPALGFTFRGQATATTVAILGAEVNGYYADRGDQPPAASAFPDLPLTGEGGGS